MGVSRVQQGTPVGQAAAVTHIDIIYGIRDVNSIKFGRESCRILMICTGVVGIFR